MKIESLRTFLEGLNVCFYRKDENDIINLLNTNEDLDDVLKDILNTLKTFNFCSVPLILKINDEKNCLILEGILSEYITGDYLESRNIGRSFSLHKRYSKLDNGKIDFNCRFKNLLEVNLKHEIIYLIG